MNWQYRFLYLAILAIIFSILACGQNKEITANQLSGDTLVTTTIKGLERTYLIHATSELEREKELPLVFVFHGYSGNADAARFISGFNRIADENQFIVVYPNGSGYDESSLSWNGGRCCFYARDQKIDDVGFVQQILLEMQSSYAIDSQRIYATGMSNGGIFTYRLGCEMADTFAAIAPVAGSLLYEPCEPSGPISVIHVHGLDDNVVPYNGSPAPPQLSDVGFNPVENGIAFWAQKNGCPDKPQIEQNGDITHTTYESCLNDTAVELYAIAGIGHTWPLLKFQTSRVIWEFFAAHAKP